MGGWAPIPSHPILVTAPKLDWTCLSFCPFHLHPPHLCPISSSSQCCWNCNIYFTAPQFPLPSFHSQSTQVICDLTMNWGKLQSQSSDLHFFKFQKHILLAQLLPLKCVRMQGPSGVIRTGFAKPGWWNPGQEWGFQKPGVGHLGFPNPYKCSTALKQTKFSIKLIATYKLEFFLIFIRRPIGQCQSTGGGGPSGKFSIK